MIGDAASGPAGATDEQRFRAEFARQGVVHIPACCPPEELAAIEAHLERVVAARLERAHDVTVVRGQAGAVGSFRVLEDVGTDPFFDGLGRSPRWTDLATMLLGEPVAPAVRDAYSDFGWQALFNLEPGSTDVTPPHQDNRYYNFRPAHTISLWLALDHVDPAGGGLHYVAGSHRDGLRAHRPGDRAGFSQVVVGYGAAERAREVSFVLAPGDVVAHHGLTIHRAGPNRTPRRRWGHSLFFRSVHCHRDEDAHRRYLDELEHHNRTYVIGQDT